MPKKVDKKVSGRKMKVILSPNCQLRVLVSPHES